MCSEQMVDNARAKSALFSIVQGIALLPVFAGITGIYDNRNVDVRPDGIGLSAAGECIWADGFGDSNAWSNVEYSGECLTVRMGGAAGNMLELFCTTNKPKMTYWDTYCSVRTKPFPLKGGECRYLITFLLEADFSRPFSVSGYDAPTWSNLVFFFDKAGKEIERRPLAYSASGQGFAEIRLEGAIPPSAASFAFQIGFDRPDVPRGRKLTFRDLKVRTIGRSPKREARGSFVSEIRRGGGVAWVAEKPEGTAVGFQVACADTPAQALKASFAGPDGTAKTYFRKPFHVSSRYCRYKVTLDGRGADTPVIRSVRIGERIDSGWSLLRDVEPPFVKLVSPSPFQDAFQDLVFEVVDELPVERTSFKVEVDGKDRTGEMKGAGGRIVLAAPAGGWTNGLHNAYVTATDCRGRSHRAHKQFFRGESPAKSVFSLRKDGMLLKNGTPVFPIGITTVEANAFNHWNFDRAFRDLAEVGFNMVQSWWKMRSDEYRSTLEKYGLTSYFGIRQADSFAAGKGRDTDAIAAWYIGDDTVDNTTPSELFDRREMLRAVSPNKLTCHACHTIAAPEVSNNRNYHNCADIFLPETYPVRKNGSAGSSNCVADAGLDVYRFKQEDKLVGDGTPHAIWPLVQYFECSTLWRNPTPVEFRGMCYAAVANGANGILFYCYKDWGPGWCRGISADQQRWETVKRVVGELKQLSPVLLSEVPAPEVKMEVLSGPKTDVYGRPSVAMLPKVFGNDLYLITVNGTCERVDVRYRFPGVRTALTGEVLFGARTQAVRNVLNDNTFKPGEYWPMEVLVIKLKDFVR